MTIWRSGSGICGIALILRRTAGPWRAKAEFVDGGARGGNKRTGYVAAELFLALNGYALAADDAASTVTMLAVAAGDITEAEFAAWLRENVVRRKAT